MKSLKHAPAPLKEEAGEHVNINFLIPSFYWASFPYAIILLGIGFLRFIEEAAVVELSLAHLFIGIW